MRKLLFFFFALLASVSGAWADVTVTLNDQTDLSGITNSATSEATATHKYGVYSGSDAENTPYYTTYTTNDASGLAGLTFSTTAKILKPTHVKSGYAGYGHVIAIYPTTTDTYTFTITAPTGYYIKSCTFKAISTSSGRTFDITPLGGSKTTVSSGLTTFNLTSCGTSAGFAVAAINTNAQTLCLSQFKVTLAPISEVTWNGATSCAINHSNGSLSHGYNPESTSTWYDLFTSTSPAGLTLNSSTGAERNNMQMDASAINIHSAYNPTYTITAPSGYVICGYSITMYAKDAGSLITPSGYNSIPISTDSSNPTNILVSGLSSTSTTFTRTGTSTDGYATSFTVYLLDAVGVTYIVKDSKGSTIFTSTPIATQIGAHITTLPSQFQRDFCTYSTIDQTVTEATSVEFTATYNFPFEIFETYGNINHWYDMSVRSTWYVTSDNTEDGALKTVNANALGLATDPYQWAFVGNPYNLKIYNKDKGENFVYAWTSAANQNVPSFVDAATGNSWTIKSSTASGYTNAFLLTIPDYGYQVNQFGGEGGLLKIWNSTGTNDAGSAFKVFDVPDDFAEYVTTEIAPYMENDAAYFNWTDDARAAIGYNASYKTNCPYATYANMKNALTTALSDLNNNVNYPPTGYYRLVNSQYPNKYLGQESKMVAFTDGGTKASTIVKLTKHASSNTYTIQLQGKYIQAPDGQSSGGYPVTTSDDEVWFTPSVQGLGFASFKAGSSDYGCIHCSGSSDIVGWGSVADASHWAIEDAHDLTITLNSDGAATPTYYATFCAPFSYTVSGATAYTMKENGDYLVPTPVEGEVTAGTPVLLKGTSATATLTIGTGYATTPATGTALTGTYLAATIDGANDYVLGIDGDVVGFYHWDSNNLAANRAYVDTPASVNAYTIDWSGETGINAIGNVQSTDKAIYNMAGQRVQKAQKGLYIVNGKKMLVK